MAKIIIKKSIRKTISLSVEEDGIVLARAPRYVSNKQIEDFIYEKKSWINKRLAEMKERKEKAQRFNDLIDPNKTIYYREKARSLLTDRTDYYAEKFGLKYNGIRINGARTRWGSCNYKNGLNFNWKILFAPPQVMDYLVVHELAHTIHKNHKKLFWNKVALMHPEHKESRKWLRQNQHLLEAKLS